MGTCNSLSDATALTMNVVDAMEMDRGAWHVTVTNKPLKKNVN